MVKFFLPANSKVVEGRTYQNKEQTINPKKLRIGFVSADFGNHPGGFFTLSTFKELKKKNFELFAYSTAERKDSVLRLADFLGYNPKRNINLSGLLKIVGVQTSEILTDSNDKNLQNVMVRWDAITDPDVYEQFITVINSAFESNYQY